MKKEHSPIIFSQKKKSKTYKSHKVKNTEISSLASVSISKKEKQSLKSPIQDKQFYLEKIIEKIIEKMLNEKFNTIITLLYSQNDDSKTLADSEDKFIDDSMEIDFVQKKKLTTDIITVKYKIKYLVILAGTVDSDANFLIMFKNISKRSKLKIDIKKNIISEVLLLLLQNPLELLKMFQ